MKRIVCFYLEGCPYCAKARRAFEELRAENPAWEKIPVEWVENAHQPSELKDFDYYYVPTLYAGAEKIYEASPGDGYDKIKAEVQRALERAVA